MTALRPLLALVGLSALACAAGTPSSAPDADLASAEPSVVTNPALARARGGQGRTGGAKVKGRYIVKLKGGGQLGGDGRFAGGGALDDGLRRAGVRGARRVHRHGGQTGVYAVDADADESTFQSLVAGGEVEWVEPIRTYAFTSYNDPYYRYQWNMRGLDLEAVHARAQGQGVVVAVVDSGVTPGSDGPANLLPGWDVFDDDADASDTAAAKQSPTGSHGTHVANTIAEATNNGAGVIGVAPLASILPVRVGDYRNVTSEAIAEGITWAVDHGANVINLSVGGDEPTRVVEEAVLYAYTHNVVVVAATGNDGHASGVSYPAAYPTVIAVGAHDGGGHETSYSNHGRALALLAPGGDTQHDLDGDGKPDGILQGTITSRGWGYAMMEGTSMASPHVAGAAAILISAGIRGPDAVRAALVGGSRSVDGNRVLSIVGALDYRGPLSVSAVSNTAPVATSTPAATPAATTGPRGARGPRSATTAATNRANPAVGQRSRPAAKPHGR